MNPSWCRKDDHVPFTRGTKRGPRRPDSSTTAVATNSRSCSIALSSGDGFPPTVIDLFDNRIFSFKVSLCVREEMCPECWSFLLFCFVLVPRTFDLFTTFVFVCLLGALLQKATKRCRKKSILQQKCLVPCFIVLNSLILFNLFLSKFYTK